MFHSGSNLFYIHANVIPVVAGLDAIMAGRSPTGNAAPSKTAWPEVVGLTAEDAENKIKEDMPHATVQVVLPGHFITHDLRPNRVRLYLNSAGSVAKPATVG